MRRFQPSNGLNPSGKLDAPTAGVAIRALAIRSREFF